MKNNKLINLSLGFAFIFSAMSCGDGSKKEVKDATKSTAENVIDTRIGELEFTHSFENGYPTDPTIAKLFNEMDFQRACQAYFWSIPLISMAQWQYAYNVTLGAKNGQITFLNGYDDILGGLTFNATTPYALVFIDLGKEPWIVHMPEGEVRGAAHDMWQMEITSIVKPGKYVFVGPGQEVPKNIDTKEYKVFNTPTNSIFLGIRLIPTDPDERITLLKKVEIYPYAERKSPKPRGYITPEGRSWSAMPPRGMEYWQRLSDIINNEPVAERDRFYMAMLKPLGIEKGKAFNPTPEQTRILTEGVLVGEAMAKANDFDKSRLEAAHYVDGSHWDNDVTSPANQRREFYDELDGRAAWFYEAVTNNEAMQGFTTGKGQVYMNAYKDSDGDWLDGAENYTLHVPPNAPAELFWSITLYEVNSRDIIHNKYKVTDKSSRADIITNADGSVDLYFGPKEPEGNKKKNWIPTEPGRAFFAMLRLYSPKQAFMDRSWVIPDVKKAK